MKPSPNPRLLLRLNYAPLAGAFLLLATWVVLLPLGFSAQSPVTKATEAEKAPVRSAESQYMIGIGDVLDIRVFNRPQLSRESVRVDGDGMIRMPLIEEVIRATCRTDTELATEIARLYEEYLRNPQVEVFIKDFQSKPVSVIGAVREPGRFQLQRKVRLWEILTFAGGATDAAGGRIQIKHDPSVRTCDSPVVKTNGGEAPVSSVEEGTSWYQLSAFRAGSADENENPIVRAGDIINVVEADKIYVIGNVFRPSIVPLKGRMTLTQALATAGGVLPNTNLDKIRVMRQTPGSATKTEYIADLKSINRQQSEDIVLQAEDIVEVHSSTSKKLFNGLLNSVVPAATRIPVRVIF